MSSQAACRTCRYWAPDYMIEGAAGSEPSHDGTCRFNPPQLVQRPAGDLFSIWPPVDQDDWCGKHQRTDSLVSTLAERDLAQLL